MTLLMRRTSISQRPEEEDESFIGLVSSSSSSWFNSSTRFPAASAQKRRRRRKTNRRQPSLRGQQPWFFLFPCGFSWWNNRSFHEASVSRHNHLLFVLLFGVIVLQALVTTTLFPILLPEKEQEVRNLRSSSSSSYYFISREESPEEETPIATHLEGEKTGKQKHHRVFDGGAVQDDSFSHDPPATTTQEEQHASSGTIDRQKSLLVQFYEASRLAEKKKPPTPVPPTSTTTAKLPALTELSRPSIPTKKEKMATTTTDTVLIIGGSDGSGTRAVVEAVGALHVPMLVDDAQTLDVHAPCFYQGLGWPAVVRAVLNQTHTANYQVDDNDNDDGSSSRRWTVAQRNAILEQFQICFQQHYAIRAGRLLQGYASEESANGGEKKYELSRKIKYGFKAPVSMLLLPFFQKVFPSVKFIHVIRDGRDVALSTNTSPVDKFYQAFYGAPLSERATAMQQNDTSALVSIQAMELWNDWNTQVHEWATTMQSASNTFEYLPIRIEDLTLHRRYETLQRIADFVGSPKRPEEICRMSHKELHDMGQSVAHAADSNREQHHHNVLETLEQVPIVTNQTEDAITGVTMSLKKMQAEKRIALRKLRHQQEELTVDSKNKADVDDETSLLEPVLTAESVYQQRLQEHRNELLAHIRNPATREKFEQLQEVKSDTQKLSESVTSPEEIAKRYGKWEVLEAKDPLLLEQLQQVGGDGLSLFGYNEGAASQWTGNSDDKRYTSSVRHCTGQEDVAIEM